MTRKNTQTPLQHQEYKTKAAAAAAAAACYEANLDFLQILIFSLLTQHTHTHSALREWDSDNAGPAKGDDGDKPVNISCTTDQRRVDLAAWAGVGCAACGRRRAAARTDPDGRRHRQQQQAAVSHERAQPIRCTIRAVLSQPG